MLVQWRNDFSTEPSLALGEERQRTGGPPLVVLYPPIGSLPRGLKAQLADNRQLLLRFE